MGGTDHAFMVCILCSPFETAGNAAGKAMSRFVHATTIRDDQLHDVDRIGFRHVDRRHLAAAHADDVHSSAEGPGNPEGAVAAMWADNVHRLLPSLKEPAARTWRASEITEGSLLTREPRVLRRCCRRARSTSVPAFFFGLPTEPQLCIDGQGSHEFRAGATRSVLRLCCFG